MEEDCWWSETAAGDPGILVLISFDQYLRRKICVSVGPISRLNKIVAEISVSAPCKWTIFWLPELIRTSSFWRLIHLFFRWHANMDNLDHGKKNFQLQRWRIHFLKVIFRLATQNSNEKVTMRPMYVHSIYPWLIIEEKSMCFGRSNIKDK